jgi:hypothetical protein
MHPPLHILAHSERSISQDSWVEGGSGEREMSIREDGKTRKQENEGAVEEEDSRGQGVRRKNILLVGRERERE